MHRLRLETRQTCDMKKPSHQDAEKRGRGRPLSYDRESALHAAMRVFWKLGFDGTSYPDLTLATGMSKPTLYTAFGDKISLFREAALAYSTFIAKAYDDALELPNARDAVDAYLRLARGLESRPGEPIICFLVQGALTGSADTESLRAELNVFRRKATLKLQRRLERAKREGDLPEVLEPSVFAEFVTALTVGLSVQAVSGSNKAKLADVVSMVMSQWPSA